MSIKLSQLPDADPLDGSEYVEVTQAGRSKKTTVETLQSPVEFQADFVTLSSNTELPNERTLNVTGGALSLLDNGPGNSIDIHLPASALQQSSLYVSGTPEVTAFDGLVTIFTDLPTATPPTSEAVTGNYAVRDDTGDDTLMTLGYNAANELQLINNMRDGGILLRQISAGDDTDFTFNDGVITITNGASQNNDLRVEFASSGGVHGDIGFTAGVGSFEIVNRVHGSNVFLRAEDSFGVKQTLFDGDPDGSTTLYYDSANRMQTTSDGINVRAAGTIAIGSAQDTNVRFVRLDAQNLGLVGFDNTDYLQLTSYNHGGGIQMWAEDAGGVARLLFYGDPDNITRLYYNGTRKLEIQNDTLDFYGQSALANGGNQDTFIRLFSAAPAVLAYIGFVDLSPDFEIRHLNYGGRILLNAYDSGFTQQSLIHADPDDDVKLFDAGTEVARTLPAASGGFEVNNTLTGGGFERVLTTADLSAGTAVLTSTWLYNTSTIPADPGTGYFLGGAANLSAVTAFYISDNDTNGFNIDSMMAFIDGHNRGHLRLRNLTGTVNRVYAITSVGTGGTYWVISVVNIGGAGITLSADEKVIIEINDSAYTDVISTPTAGNGASIPIWENGRWRPSTSFGILMNDGGPPINGRIQLGSTSGATVANAQIAMRIGTSSTVPQLVEGVTSAQQFYESTDLTLGTASYYGWYSRISSVTTEVMRIHQDTSLRIRSGPAFLIEEKALANADVAGYGQLWVKSDTPNTLWFTDDAGNDFNLSGGVLPSNTSDGALLTGTGSGWAEDTLFQADSSATESAFQVTSVAGHGQMFIDADSSNTVVTTSAAPALRMTNDGGASQSMIFGQNRSAGLDAMGNAFTGIASSWGIHIPNSGYSFVIGINGNVDWVVSASSVQHYAGSTQNVTYTFSGGDYQVAPSTSPDYWHFMSGWDSVRFDSGVLINERSAAIADVTAYGQLWVKDDSPNTLWFTDDTGVDKPVGLGAYKLITNQSYDLNTAGNGEQIVNGAWYSDNATAYTLTLENSTGSEFPVGGQITIWNEGAGTLTISEGTGMTLYLLDGANVTDTAGGCTMAQGGYATIIKKSTTVWLIMGAGLTA